MKKILFGLIFTALFAGCASMGKNASHTDTAPMSSTQKLLGSGARWAARDGKKALYVNWKDNWTSHHAADGDSWGPWPDEAALDGWRSSVAQALTEKGFNVEFVGDIPEDISTFDLVVIFAYWAVEPRHGNLLNDYIAKGGSVVLMSGVPCYLNTTCKNWAPGTYDMSPIQEWFGCRTYANTGGGVRLTSDSPFDAGISKDEPLFHGSSPDFAAVGSLNDKAKAVALWDSGKVFAFTNEYGEGRVYYQAAI